MVLHMIGENGGFYGIVSLNRRLWDEKVIQMGVYMVLSNYVVAPSKGSISGFPVYQAQVTNDFFKYFRVLI
jgi:hypothetical protein